MKGKWPERTKEAGVGLAQSTAKGRNDSCGFLLMNETRTAWSRISLSNREIQEPILK